MASRSCVLVGPASASMACAKLRREIVSPLMYDANTDTTSTTCAEPSPATRRTSSSVRATSAESATAARVAPDVLPSRFWYHRLNSSSEMRSSPLVSHSSKHWPVVAAASDAAVMPSVLAASRVCSSTLNTAVRWRSISSRLM